MCVLSGTTSDPYGTCSMTYTPSNTGTGTHTITTSFGNDYYDVSSASFGLTVTPGVVSTSPVVTCPPSPMATNATISCSATVTDTSVSPVNPTGTVRFTSSPSGGVFSPTSCDLSTYYTTSCGVSYTNDVAPGSGLAITIGVTYDGDSSHDISSGTFSLTIVKDTATLYLSCSPNSVLVSQTTECTVTVRVDAGGDPFGHVIIFSSSGTGTFSHCNVVHNRSVLSSPYYYTDYSSCFLIYSPSAEGTRTHTITVTLNDPYFDLSTASFDVTVSATVFPTATTVTCNSPVAAGVPTYCSVTVTDTSSSSTTNYPSGSVSFSSVPGTGVFSPANCNIPNCSAFYTNDASPDDGVTITISASYDGDASHGPSSGSTLLAVVRRTTSSSLSCVPDGVIASQSTICTVIVADNSYYYYGANRIPLDGYSVAFSSAGAGAFSSTSVAQNECILQPYPYGNYNLAGTCSVTYTPSDPGTGTHTITSVFSNNRWYASSQATFDLKVTPGLVSTATSITCPSPVVTGANVACTIIVTSSIPSMPTGSVTFTTIPSGGILSPTSCSLILYQTGSAYCDVTYTNDAAPGPNGASILITASYAGDASHDISNGSFSLSVIRRTLTSYVSCTPNNVLVTQSTVCAVTLYDYSVFYGYGYSPVGLAGQSVTFSSNGIGTFSNSGTTTNSCVLSGPDYGAGCFLTYVPTEVGTGAHTITTSFGNDYFEPTTA